jgi:hypothetical protein
MTCSKECEVGFFCWEGIKNPCSAGRYGIDTDNDEDRMTSKSFENTACQKCPTSKYGILSGQSGIKSSCLQCPTGRYGGDPGQTNNTDNFCPNTCEPDKYLDATINECRECPEGGFCPGGTDINGVIAKTGYWRVPVNDSIIFVKCLNPCACLGARNSEVHGCVNKQIGKIKFPEGCNVDEGYREGSRLCADCMNGYSRDGKGKCKPCHKEKGFNIFLFV